jgi:replicative DNA helicase
MTVGKDFLAAVAAKGTISDILQQGPITHLFTGTEVEVWKFVHEFVKKYGSFPTPETIQAHTSIELPTVSEPPAYYRDLMETRYVEMSLKTAMKTASEALQPGAAGASAALGGMTETILKLLRTQNGASIADLRDALDLLMPAYKQQSTGAGGEALMLGWPYLDEMTGGLRKGDLVSFIGRPALGKTWQMLFGALYGWLTAEANPEHPGVSRMFVSMEMNVLPVEQRLASMVFATPFDKIKKAQLSTAFPDNLTKFTKNLKTLKGFKKPFWIVDGNLTSTVDDILILVRQLKPDAIFIDGAYLLQHPKAQDRYKRVAENVDLLKRDIAAEAPCVCSWQFNRDATKKKGGDEAGLEDIGYTDAIPQHSALVLGLFESDSVETLKHRRIKVLKGRSGETGQFMVKFDFDHMDFSQYVQKSVEELHID